MAKRKAAVSSHGHQGTKDEIKIARGSASAAGEQLEDFLTDPPGDARDEAWQLFPGRSPTDALRRAAFVDVVTAGWDGARGVAWLECAREIVAQEIRAHDVGPRLTEDALVAARDLLAAAARKCSRSLGGIRRARQLAGRPRLRVVS